mgnify:CR=1 FL=1
MKKYCLAAAAALCAVMMTACGAGNGAPADTSAQSETESVTESVSETVSETEAASSEETTVSETEEPTETSETKEAFTCADIVAEIENTVELPSMADIGADRVHMYLDFEIPEGCDFAMSICGSGGFADEYDKLENYFSKYSGGYYMYVVTADNAACENIFDNYVK